MRVVLLGPPGAGKGSLAGVLKDKYHLAHISTGDMLREEIKKGSALGLEIKNLIAQGALVSDELVTKLVEQRIGSDPDLKKGYMFDGFPRTVKQAQDLDALLAKANAPLDFALNMEADANLLLKRLTGRRVCRKCGALFHMTNKPPLKAGVCDLCGGELYQRTDDNEETIKARMQVYQTSTQPIIDYYAKQHKLKKLDGNLETVDLGQSVATMLKMKTSQGIRLKNANEVDILRKAGKILSSIVVQLQGSLTSGMSTKDIDSLAETLIHKNKVTAAFKGYRGFPGVACISVNEGVVHGIPGKRVIKDGDIVSLDIGIIYEGYYSDTAVTVPVGNISPEIRRLLDVTQASLSRGIEQARVGNKLSDISFAVQTFVEMHGFSVVRDFVGHGIGQQLHEEPEIPNYGRAGQGPVLVEGMVFAIEPMVNMGTHRTKILSDGWTVVTEDGKPSAHFEHSIVITAKGPEILTQ